MSGAEVIDKMLHGEVTAGTKMRYKYKGWGGKLISGTCSVDTSGGLIGIFIEGHSISSVILIHGTFEII